MEQKTKLWIGSICGFLILLSILGGVYFITGGGDREYITFTKVHDVPQDAVVIHLTEEDYQKYPMLKNIPQTINIDKSVFSPILKYFGIANKETANQIWEVYGDYTGHEYVIEHKGIFYQVGLAVS